VATTLVPRVRFRSMLFLRPGAVRPGPSDAARAPMWSLFTLRCGDGGLAILDRAADARRHDVQLRARRDFSVGVGELQREILAFADRDQVEVEVENVLTARAAVRAEDVDRVRAGRAADARRELLGH